MKKSKVLALLLVLALMVSIFAACGTKDGASSSTQDTNASASSTVEKKEPVTIQFSWWGEKARHDGTLAAIKLWNEKNPDIQVETYFSGWDDYNAKLETQFVSQTAPDVFQFSPAKLKEYVAQKQLADVTPFIEKDFAGIDKSLWASTSVDGKPYGVASGINGYVLAYNKTKLTQMGIALPTDNETWDQLLEKAKLATKDTNGDGKVDFWGIHSLLDAPIEMFYPYLRQNGVEMWTSDLKGSNFGDPKALEALKKWEEFEKQGACVPADVTLTEGAQYLPSGYSAFQLTTLSAFSSLQDMTKDELGIVNYPVVEGGPEVRETTGGLPIGIYAGSKHQEEAAKFLSWLLTDPEAAKASGMVRGIFPSTAQREGVAQTLSESQQQVMRVANVISALGIEKGYPNPLHLGEFTDIWLQEIGKYNFKQVNIETFLENIMKNADPVLNQD